MNDPDFSLQDARVTIVGLGLMGGSLALALQGHCRELIGVEANSAAAAFALERGLVGYTTDFDSALAGTDVVVLATPVQIILDLLGRLTHTPAPESPVTLIDLGSTKSAILAAMRDLPPGFDPIGGHPMCGKETGGIAHAEPGLYRGRAFVLCPLERTSTAAFARAHHLVAALGAHPLVMDAARHDALAALVSHLPYAAAVAVMRTVLRSDDDLGWQMAASGFRDTTRLAASDLTMMIDILLTNRDAILDSLAGFRVELDSLAAAIQSGDAVHLRQALEAAQARRAGMFPPGPAGGESQQTSEAS